MNKKLTRYDLIISLGFIFALIVGLAAFFYGLQTGKEQTDRKYKAFMEQLQDEQSQTRVAYHQQQLVSFYHTVLLPFRDFQKAWFENLSILEAESKSADSSELVKQLGRLADEKYKEIEPSTIPEVSPKLINAHRNYLKSLKLFSEAAGRIRPGSKTSGALLAERLRKDEYVQEAYAFALQAQSQYYEAILEWNRASDPSVPEIERLGQDNVTMSDWRHWNLNTKNVHISRMLLKDGTFFDFYPQDVSSRIDDLDATGEAGKLKLESVQQTAHTLLSAGGVRAGDYLRLKEKLYKNEALPQLPFFFE
ncbi:hypothetical protein [Paenibacillus thermotolerans]|uniref:hypothetical protein n=1 Tax=Paenibacillus thermotolerans TaxID=3027807 RepID=UPI0023676024|nr:MULTISPECIES: hypothetical protein [unclassified Paenibacillus]